ncbi:hypothetical protein ACFL23_00360 [Patescibacteria group bacterium]
MGIIMSSKDYRNILKVCASQQVVKEAVFKNHDNNLWWPLAVKDWRIRMIVAGLSTRVSYRMIKTYQSVVSNLDSYSYEAIAFMAEKNFKDIVKPIGLSKTRVDFWRSMVEFIEYLCNHNIDVKNINNDKLIQLIQDRVYGSGYKVAQCCTLYARGYYCGIMPVDSGMLTLLCPAIGLPAPNSPFGHEIMRKQLEALTIDTDCRKIAIEKGYNSLALPKDKPLTWWAHLVLIYYKRFFSRKNDPAGLPLRTHLSTKNLVAQIGQKDEIKLGGVKNIIFEGLNGVGKTTITKMLAGIGFNRIHFNYNSDTNNLFLFYQNLLQENFTLPKRFVFDRSFVSEIVYGRLFRNKSRLTKKHIKLLLKKLKEQNSVFIYLYAPLDSLLERDHDKNKLISSYSSLMERYERVINFVAQYIPIVRIDSQKNSSLQIFSQITGFEFIKKK